MRGCFPKESRAFSSVQHLQFLLRVGSPKLQSLLSLVRCVDLCHFPALASLISFTQRLFGAACAWLSPRFKGRRAGSRFQLSHTCSCVHSTGSG